MGTCTRCGEAAKEVARLEGELAEAKGLPTDSEVCQSCGSAVAVVWAAKDEDWRKIVGGPGGLLCPKCFADRAWTKRRLSLAFIAVPLAKGWSTTEWYGARAECDELKKVMAEVVAEMDALMVGTSTRERGMAIAKLMGYLSDASKIKERPEMTGKPL